MMKKILLLSVLTLLSACKDEPPAVKVDTYNTMNTVFNIPYVKVRVTALADQVTLKAITVNQGNCKIENLFGKLPVTLKYGQYVEKTFSGPCRASRVDVETDQGSWFWNYK